jgi:hypothetical protein
MQGLCFFKPVEDELFPGLRRMAWLGNGSRATSACLCLSYNGRTEAAIDSISEHINTSLFPGAEQEASCEVVHDVSALYDAEAAERLQDPQVILDELLAKPVQKLNYLELGVEGDGGDLTRQSMVPMQGHVSFLGIGFGVHSLPRLLDHFEAMSPGSRDTLPISSLLSMPRCIMLEDEAGIPLEISDGVVANMAADRR